MAASKAPSQPRADAPVWVKYSPHHELPISGLTSLAWHALGALVIIAVAFVISRNNDSEMPIEAVTIGNLGGGGGNPQGVGTSRGTSLVEAASEKELPRDAVIPNEPLADINDLQINPTDLFKDLNLDTESKREFARIAERGTQSLKKLAGLDQKTRDSLMPHGRGGPGAGGGSGAGDGPSTGPGEGASGSIRVKRQIRWTIMFNTTSGYDYLRQLETLGAILAVRTPEGDLRTIHNLLERPVQLVNEDVRKLNRINWIDDKRDTVAQLAAALGLSFTPPEIIALFPYKFERELLDKELKFRGRKEAEILETRFQILMRPGNTYQIVVTDQRWIR